MLLPTSVPYKSAQAHTVLVVHTSPKATQDQAIIQTIDLSSAHLHPPSITQHIFVHIPYALHTINTAYTNRCAFFLRLLASKLPVGRPFYDHFSFA